jgi:anti-sigma regulatory factor (Ser/Thr protein kinase)
VDAVTDALLSAAVGTLGAACATVWTTDDKDVLVVTGARGEPPDAARLPTAGQLLQERGASSDDGRVVVPLQGQSALRGLLSLVPREDPAGDPVDLELLTAVGQQGGLALDRAQLYEQSASVARELQHSLLAVEPPHDARFRVATAYRAGVELLEVGGDWFDVFLVQEGVLAVVVGDVVGRGLGAASAMGQLRSAVRAVAGPEVGPARLLVRLDRFVEQVEAAGMATLAYAELELATGRLRYACAGHPPPLLLPAGGGAQLLWDGRSTPLGGFVRPMGRAEAEIELAPTDRLMLYTDGLFERRERDLVEGLEVLTAAAAQLGPLPLDEAVRALTTTLLQDESSRDDVCVLLLSWSDGEFERHLSADLRELSPMRHELAAWLRDKGLDGQVCDDLVLSASEAVANAAEHGSRFRTDVWVTVRARLDEQEDVVLVVEDQGRWRTTESSHERGRGLMIMSALVDEAEVIRGEGTRVVLHKRTRPEAS